MAQVWPFPVHEAWPHRIGDRAMDTYHRWMEVVVPATMAGLPAISVPVGFDGRGLPMGLQVIGRPRGDLEQGPQPDPHAVRTDPGRGFRRIPRASPADDLTQRREDR